MRSCRFVELMWRAVVAISLDRANAAARDLISDQRKDRQRAQEDEPKPLPIPCQQRFLLGNINRDLHCVGLSGIADGD